MPTPPPGGYPALRVAPKTGDEVLHRGGHPLGPALRDFWRWSASDLLSNAARGVLAEWLVANALGVARGVRAEWDAFDLVTPSGLRLEVKSAAYLQSWAHARLSTIAFGIRPTQAWSDDANAYSAERRRQADVYVFCLLHHQDKATVDPLDLAQWTFFVLPAAVLDARCGAQKTIGLASLLRLSPVQTDYDGLAAAVTSLDLPPTVPPVSA